MKFAARIYIPLLVGSVCVLLLIMRHGVMRDVAGEVDDTPATIVRVDDQADARPGSRSARFSTSTRRNGSSLNAQTTSPALIVEGMVLDPDNEGLSGADVWITETVMETSGAGERLVCQTRSVEKGRYSLPLNDVATSLVLNAYLKGYAPAGLALTVDQEQIRGGQGRLLVFPRLQVAAAVKGRVVDSAGAPVPSAQVTVSYEDRSARAESPSQQQVSIQTFSASTGSDGRFLFDPVPEGQLTVRADLAGFTGQQRTIRAPAEDVQLQLSREGGTVEGNVFLLDGGAGLPGVSVQLVPTSGTGGTSHTVVTDQVGGFGFSDLPEGTYRISAKKDKLRLTFANAMSGNDIKISSGEHISDLHLMMYAGHTLVGKVTDAQSQKGVDGVEVKVLCSPPASGITGADGTYSISGVCPDGAGYLAIVDAHKTDYVVAGPPEAPELVRLNPAVREAHKDFKLDKLITISGHVTNADGVPVAGATVHDNGGSDEVVSVGDGSYSLKIRARRLVIASATAPGHAPGTSAAIELDGETTSGVDIVLGTEGIIRGKVVDRRGSPVAKAEVFLHNMADGRDRKIEANENGNFEARGLPLGRIAGYARCSGFAVGNLNEAELTPEMPEAKWIIVMSDARHLAGTVTDEAGQPVSPAYIVARKPATQGTGEQARLMMMARGWTGCASDKQGRFHIYAIPEEKVELRVTANGYESLIQPDVETNRDDLRLVLKSAVSITLIGSVVDAQTSEPVNQFAIAYSAGGRVTRQEAGAFAIENIESGKDNGISITAPGYRALDQQVGRLSREEPVVQRTFVMQREPGAK